MSRFKTHVALNVSDLKKSVDFYQAMLGQSPVKYKADYAKFDLGAALLGRRAKECIIHLPFPALLDSS